MSNQSAWKRILVTAGVAAATVSTAAGQSRPTPADPGAPLKVSLGEVTVTIPAPAGFEEKFASSDDIRKRFASTQTQDTLAVHIPKDVAASLQPGQALSFYTLVRVSKELRAVDVTAEDFAALAKELTSKKIFSAKEAQDYIAAAQRRTGISMGRPIELGLVARTPESVSTLMIVQLASGESSATRLCVTATVFVRRRVLFFFSFRDFGSAEDLKTLPDFSSQWLQAILASNR